MENMKSRVIGIFVKISLRTQPKLSQTMIHVKMSFGVHVRGKQSCLTCFATVLSHVDIIMKRTNFAKFSKNHKRCSSFY